MFDEVRARLLAGEPLTLDQRLWAAATLENVRSVIEPARQARDMRDPKSYLAGLFGWLLAPLWALVPEQPEVFTAWFAESIVWVVEGEERSGRIVWGSAPADRPFVPVVAKQGASGALVMANYRLLGQWIDRGQGAWSLKVAPLSPVISRPELQVSSAQDDLGTWAGGQFSLPAGHEEMPMAGQLHVVDPVADDDALLPLINDVAAQVGLTVVPDDTSADKTLRIARLQ